MLRHSMFSDFYLSRRQARADEHSQTPVINGSLAIAADRQRDKKLVLSRAASRTWWESGWQQR